MTIKSYEMGPGTFRLGSGGDALVVSSQTRKAEIDITPNVTVREGKKVLSGEQKARKRSVRYETGNLAVTLIQDLEAGGIVAYSYTHAGQKVPFILAPNDDLERAWSGFVYVDPIKGGGEVDADDPESDLSWEIEVTQAFDEDGNPNGFETPIFGVYDPVEDEVTPDV